MRGGFQAACRRGVAKLQVEAEAEAPTARRRQAWEWPPAHATRLAVRGFPLPARVFAGDS
ncbi:hypothetical protein ACP70R_029635 [Stipagrostis hirtigluma subsp. patula]